VFNSSKGAERYATDVEAMLKLGKVQDVFTDPAPTAPAPTLKEAAERWLAVDGARMKAGTLDTYQSILKHHLLPLSESRRLTDITVADIENWWATQRASGRSHKALGNCRTVLHSIFQRPVTSGTLPRNPADAIKGHLGREDREVRQAEWLSEQELLAFLDVAAKREPRYYPFLLTIATTGLRAGEVTGLQVLDLDFEQCRLAIRRAIRKHKVGSPKSGKPRTVDAPEATMTVLRDWIGVIRAEAAVRGQEATWLFPSQTGQPVDEALVRAAFNRCLKAAGILRHFRIHDLRHSYASLALQRGVDLLVVSRQLGHASIAITADIYSHLMPNATRAAADALQAILTMPFRNLRATDAPEAS
jgi:integrase